MYSSDNLQRFCWIVTKCTSSVVLFLMHYFHEMTGNIKAERFTDSTSMILCRPLVGQILYTASWTMNKTFQNQTKMSFYISKLRTKTQKCLLLHYDLESSPSKCMVRSCYWLQTTICYSANEGTLCKQLSKTFYVSASWCDNFIHI